MVLHGYFFWLRLLVLSKDPTGMLCCFCSSFHKAMPNKLPNIVRMQQQHAWGPWEWTKTYCQKQAGQRNNFSESGCKPRLWISKQYETGGFVEKLLALRLCCPLAFVTSKWAGRIIFVHVMPARKDRAWNAKWIVLSWVEMQGTIRICFSRVRPTTPTRLFLPPIRPSCPSTPRKLSAFFLEQRGVFFSL